MNERQILTRQQTADYLTVGLTSLDKMIARRDNPLPHIRVGRRVVIPREALERWIQEETERNGGAQ